MIETDSSKATTFTRTARLYDGGAKKLTLEHLQRFVDEAERLGLKPGTEVRLEKKLNSEGGTSTIEISATVAKTEPVF